MCSDGTTGFNLNKGRFRLNIRKKCCKDGEEQVAKGSWECPIPVSVKGQVGTK